MDALLMSIIELIKSSPLIITPAEKDQWITQVLPKLDEAGLLKVQTTLQEGQKAHEEYQKKRLEHLKDKYTKVQEILKDVHKKALQYKEEKNRKEDQIAIEALERELEEL